MSTETFRTSAEAADTLRISNRTLERYRVEGTGPKFMKAGRRVLYREQDLLAWLEAHTFSSTAEAAAA